MEPDYVYETSLKLFLALWSIFHAQLLKMFPSKYNRYNDVQIIFPVSVPLLLIHKSANKCSPQIENYIRELSRNHLLWISLQFYKFNSRLILDFNKISSVKLARR